MRVSALICGVVFAFSSAASALAQNTLGDLLDGGAKKLTKAEMEATLGGATVSGPTRAGGTFQADFKTDGTYKGALTGPQGKSGGMFGTWKVDDAGQMCSEFTTSLGAAGSRQVSNCGFYFKLSAQYYYAESDTDRSAQALKRTVQK